MRAVKSKDSAPERLVRSFLQRRGFRFRKNDPRLPGKPDAVLPKYRTVVFVDGCFWHGHEGCPKYRIPKTNAEYWKRKIDGNRRRDRREDAELARMGWHVVRIWECSLAPKKRQSTLESLAFTLNRIFLINAGAEPEKGKSNGNG